MPGCSLQEGLREGVREHNPAHVATVNRSESPRQRDTRRKKRTPREPGVWLGKAME